MSEDERAQLEGLATKATGGPWRAIKYTGSVSIWVGDESPRDRHQRGFPTDTPLCTFHNRIPGSGAGDPQMLADAALAAASRAAIPALLAEMRRSRDRQRRMAALAFEYQIGLTGAASNLARLALSEDAP